jgi:hypothetical protein
MMKMKVSLFWSHYHFLSELRRGKIGYAKTSPDVLISDRPLTGNAADGKRRHFMRKLERITC